MYHVRPLQLVGTHQLTNVHVHVVSYSSISVHVHVPLAGQLAPRAAYGQQLTIISYLVL